jgi:hypothetical protein
MSLKKSATAVLTTTAAALLLAGCGSSATTLSAAPAASATSSAPAASAQPWSLPSDISAAAAKAGLQMLGQEMLTVHYHVHLDVIVDGQPVTVPAGIGIDQVQQKISALHTHQTDGILHIESATDIPFTLGQAFTEWGQPLSATQVGPVAIGSTKALHVFVNAHEVTTDPAKIVLHSHDEIVVWVGDKNATPQVPTYTWNTANYPQ